MGYAPESTYNQSTALRGLFLSVLSSLQLANQFMMSFPEDCSLNFLIVFRHLSDRLTHLLCYVFIILIVVIFAITIAFSKSGIELVNLSTESDRDSVRNFSTIGILLGNRALPLYFGYIKTSP